MLHVTPRTREGQRTKVAKEVCGAASSASRIQTYAKQRSAKIRRSKHNTVRNRTGEHTYEAYVGNIPHHRKSKRPTEDGNGKTPWHDETPAAARLFA